MRGRLRYLKLEAPAVETVEPEVTAIESNVTAVLANVAAVMTDFNAVMADIAAVCKGCLGLGSNSGEEKANGE